MAVLSATELFELFEQVSVKLGSDELLSALSLANRQGNLEGMLDSMGLGSLLDGDDARGTKIAVLGASPLGESKLRAIARREGFDPDDFEFCLDYDRLKRFNFSKLRYNDSYAAVFAGPQPHSTTGKGEAGSAIAEMEARPGVFPPVIRLTDANELKITANSFHEALQKVQSILPA